MVEVDVSAATMSGPKASQYVADCVLRWPALRPLVLIVKALLKVGDLSDGPLRPFILSCVPCTAGWPAALSRTPNACTLHPHNLLCSQSDTASFWIHPLSRVVQPVREP